MNQRTTIGSGIMLIAILLVSTVVVIHWIENSNTNSEFFVGVEFAYSNNVNDLKDLVDKVENYTNLFVLGALDVTFNRTALDESCDYIVNSGLHLIVLFTESTKYDYNIFNWLETAGQKYGEKFLGVYRFDEPGGNQLDKGDAIVKNATSYAGAAAYYTESLGLIVNYYLNYTSRVFTSDYGLYWFDYKAGYSTVFVEFGWNHSRPLHTALCRGAAQAYGRNWGVIVTWEYNDAPYIEPGKDLYRDMILAYKSGAKYVVVFDYPKIEQYGILTEEHFNALKDFWDYIHSNPQEKGVVQGKVAYVLPRDYGFGFRSPNDSVWGLWNADDLSRKVWDDTKILIDQYEGRLDIIYGDPEVMNAIESRYERLFFWNETAR